MYTEIYFRIKIFAKEYCIELFGRHTLYAEKRKIYLNKKYGWKICVKIISGSNYFLQRKDIQFFKTDVIE